ncbi:MAG: ParB/RepB/Spo0J family partition protein [Psychrobacter sp.]|jgi:ParB family chromosome partitioning protein|uniref:Probable chromosome-partitioning protein ParB n=1 Tax=Psychrobacter namhaensis TaxID=292734 RepID=A0ABW8L5X8_9GAMM|nr:MULTISPECIES: ParB/RepB/Spo0J family partition protein [Psychrobacter]MCD1279314.1 ParB/RepB/Spo0J family partition protein [Psychrobacter sp. CCUG 69069]MCD6252629.1 ParB/RepB/Spo0J family partition protein [Psychrobacter sp.]HCN18318.1 chromosome partitioning protein ParB [Psychrobacter sp.]|tara:strand:- start:17295 stop:18425 length:1131 start_codon:yes stop_codon:yes gene_type:complete
MAKKRGLAANRGLDALLGSIKKEKQITASALQDDMAARDHALPADTPTKHAPAHPDRAKPSETLIAKPTAPDTSDTSHRKARLPRTTSKAAANKSRGIGSDTSVEDQISLVQIDVTRLQAGKYQPRRDMSETALAELASSIEQHGVMQPIVIRPLLANEDKSEAFVTHEIIAGERRWRAAKMAGKSVIPAIERALSDELAIALALIENIQREDLSVIEQAAALQRFHTEFGMSHAMIAEVVGKARTTVSNLLRLNQLHDTVKDHLANSALDMGHARTLLALSSDQQPIIAQKIIDGGMTVREAEKLVKSILQPPPKTNRTEQVQSRDAEQLTQRLTDVLGAQVKLKHKKDGQGSVEIFFHSQDQLAALIKHIEAQG